MEGCIESATRFVPPHTGGPAKGEVNPFVMEPKLSEASILADGACTASPPSNFSWRLCGMCSHVAAWLVIRILTRLFPFHAVMQPVEVPTQ